MPVSGRFVGDAYMRPVAFSRYIVTSGTVATGGIYAAPTTQPIIFIIIFGRRQDHPAPAVRCFFRKFFAEKSTQNGECVL